MSRKNKKVRMSSRIDLADALRKESSLSAFTFDGPYRLTGHDLLDNMYCADNGRWYETPVDWYGLARAARQTSWHQSALYFKRNVLLGCYIPQLCQIAGDRVMADLRAAYAMITAQALPELRDSTVRAGIRFAYNFKSLRCNDAAVNVQTAAP